MALKLEQECEEAAQRHKDEAQERAGAQPKGRRGRHLGETSFQPHNRGRGQCCVLQPCAKARGPAGQEGVMNFHFCLRLPINSLALNVKANSPDKFKDETSVDGT